MARREWTIEDRFGRAWRLALEAGSSGEQNTSDVMRDLVQTSLTSPPNRSDRVAEALFAIAAAVSRDRDAYDDWLRLPYDEAFRVAADVRAQLAQASALGLIIAEPFNRITRLHYEEEAPASEPKAPQAEPDDWIGIELVDEEGKPVANMEYRIEGPSGDVHTGITDASGTARVAGLTPGSCKISFPNLHGPDWKKVG